MRTAPPPTAVETPRPTLERRRLRLDDGAATTVHVARFSRTQFDLRVVALQPCATVLGWCERSGAEHAIVGGFYMRPGGPALGDLWIGGQALATEPFDAPWHEQRACVHAGAGKVRLAARRNPNAIVELRIGGVSESVLLEAEPAAAQ